MQTAAAAYAFRLDGEPLAPLWVAPLQQLLYRPLMYAVLVRSLLSAVTGGRVRWQRIQRLGALRALMPGSPAAAPGGSTTRAAAPVRVSPRRPRRVPGAVLPATPVVPVASGAGARVAPARGEAPATRLEATRIAAAHTGTTTADASRGTNGGSPSAGRDSADRSRWLDVLRAIALVRVVGYHVLGWGWLSFVFPSMGVMFALGGSLMLASLRRAEAVDVIGRRIKRLLPPFWLFGLFIVPVMLWHGFGEEPVPDAAQWLFWVVPILDPPGSEWANDATVVLWYIRTYLWLVLLTPLLLAAWRRRPAVAMAVPLGIVVVDALLDGGVRDFGSVGTGVVDAAVFAGCWMLGFAHRDGSLRRLAAGRAVLLAGAAIAVGVAWALSHPAGDDGIDLNDIPLGQSLVSLGAVLLVLRYTPRLAWLERVPGLGRLVTVINARAVTIYLWHNVAIALAGPINERLGWPSLGALIGTSVVLTTVFALGLGWVEDLAAGRRPALLPGPGQRALRRREPRRPAPMPPVIGDGGLMLPAETEESSLAALNALRPASDFRRDPRFAAAGAPSPVATRSLPPGPASSPARAATGRGRGWVRRVRVRRVRVRRGAVRRGRDRRLPCPRSRSGRRRRPGRSRGSPTRAAPARPRTPAPRSGRRRTAATTRTRSPGSSVDLPRADAGCSRSVPTGPRRPAAGTPGAGIASAGTAAAERVGAGTAAATRPVPTRPRRPPVAGPTAPRPTNPRSTTPAPRADTAADPAVLTAAPRRGLPHDPRRLVVPVCVTRTVGSAVGRLGASCA